MFSRALRTARASPLRSNAFSRAALVKRTVTTDAAAAELKESVPEVRLLLGVPEWPIELADV
jgi:pyruvate dehydrogenase E1 component alpha subunit